MEHRPLPRPYPRWRGVTPLLDPPPSAPTAPQLRTFNASTESKSLRHMDTGTNQSTYYIGVCSPEPYRTGLSG